MVQVLLQMCSMVFLCYRELSCKMSKCDSTDLSFIYLSCLLDVILLGPCSLLDAGPCGDASSHKMQEAEMLYGGTVLSNSIHHQRQLESTIIADFAPASSHILHKQIWGHASRFLIAVGQAMLNRHWQHWQDLRIDFIL